MPIPDDGTNRKQLYYFQVYVDGSLVYSTYTLAEAESEASEYVKQGKGVSIAICTDIVTFNES